MAPAFLNTILCCLPCSTKDKGKASARRRDELIDETSHLIEPNLGPDEPDRASTLPYHDQQRLKDRLGMIVKSKEGKMINVHSTPFRRSNGGYGATSSYAYDDPPGSGGNGSRSDSEGRNGAHSPSYYPPPNGGSSVLFTNEQPHPHPNPHPYHHPYLNSHPHPPTTLGIYSDSRSGSRESSSIRSGPNPRSSRIFNARLVDNGYRATIASTTRRGRSRNWGTSSTSQGPPHRYHTSTPNRSVETSAEPSPRLVVVGLPDEGLMGEEEGLDEVMDPEAKRKADEAAQELAQKLQAAPALSLSWDD